MSETATTEKEELASLVRARGNSKGLITRTKAKWQTIKDQSTRDIDHTYVTTLIDTCQQTLERLRELCEELVTLQPTHQENHLQEMEVSEGLIDELMDKLIKMAKRGRACGKLEDIYSAVTAFKIAASGDPQQLTNHLNKQEKLFDQVRDEYRGVIRSDKMLQGLSDNINLRVAELIMQLPRIPTVAPTYFDRSDSTTRRDAPTPHHRRLPNIQIPKFGGDFLHWEEFWIIFDRTIHSNGDLSDHEKRSYLQQSVKDQVQTNLVDTLSVSYDECVASLKARYHLPRKMHQHFTKNYFECAPAKEYSKAEMTRVHATLSRARTQMLNTKHFTLDAAMTSYGESCLPQEIRKEWARETRDPNVIPKVVDLLKFMEFQAVEAPELATPSHKPRRERHDGSSSDTPHKSHDEKPHSKKKPSPHPKRDVFAASGKSWPDCKLCSQGSHPMYACNTYLSYDLKKRLDYVQKSKRCHNCLGEGHDVSVCRNTYRCRECAQKHNTTLHKPTDIAAADPGVAPEVLMAKPTGMTASSTISPTLEVTVHAPKGKQLKVTALFDLGATISLVTDKVVDQLGLQRRHSDIQVVGVNGDKIDQSRPSTVALLLTSPHKKGGQLSTRAYVVPRIGGGQGGRIEDGDWSALEGLQLANPNFQRPSRLDVLLGNDVLGKLELTDGIRKDERGYLVVRNTIFGWVVNGKVHHAKQQDSLKRNNNYLCDTTGQELTNQLLEAQNQTDSCIKEFLAIESMPEESTPTEEDAAALSHYQLTHQVLPDGHFQVSLPKLPMQQELGKSRAMAVKRYMNTERSLLRKGKLAQFQAVMLEYFDLRHAELVPTEELNKPDSETFYLPMHSVFKDSSTSPLRVVFDASANSSSGVSLNDTLMTGPTVYPLLTTILMRFRTHNIALTADIGKMFRCIFLNPSDRSLHRFVWRKSPTEPLRDYQMTRVTFGVSCSPFMATQTLQQIAHNNMTTHPNAARALQEAFYVDDYIAGAATKEQALEVQKELQEVLSRHGLVIRKWRSSSAAVLQEIPDELQEKQPNLEPYGPQEHLKTLGIHWNAMDDSFHVSTSKLQTTVVTKRTLASDVAQTFDVLGWFAPATILMKLMIQDLWRSNHDWDDPTNDETQKRWNKWKSELPHLAASPLPRRYYHQGVLPTCVQLHGFADASLKGYAAVVYLRATYQEAAPTVRLVMAKTKVTPVKGTTVPRLELCAALLLSELITHVRKALNVSESDIHCWSDSQVVLFWLDGRSRKHRVYVANRVNRTLEMVSSSHWLHVPGIENPADCASRGISPLELLNHPLWWQGPDWLQQEPYHCPPQPHLAHPMENDTIMKEMAAVVEQQAPLLILSRSHCYNKSRRTLAWILRFKHNARCTVTKDKRISGRQLLLSEITRAETKLFIQAQRRLISEIHPDRWLSHKDTRSLNPKRDELGVYRVDGRLNNADLPYQTRHPVILRGKDPLTEQLMLHHHLTTLHGGPSQVMSSLSRQFFVIHGMAVVKAICRKCVICFRFRAEREHQLMGQLPSYRVNPGHPFAVVGTDFAGPIALSEGKARKRKGYICVFVCLKTKAIHLEAVTGLGTTDFLACLRRFVARRGRPTHIMSDNGTNFTGAARELDLMHQAMQSDEMQESVSQFCTSQEIEWIFNPARAPHFGGLWEATVKSVKFHLKRIENRRHFNYQEMSTILAQIEAVLNSRPLMAIHCHSHEGLEVLTAGHFLIGRPLLAIPERPISDEGNLAKRWDSCQQAAQRFWKEWSRDYLQLFHRRCKWQKPARNVSVGDIVLLRDEPQYSTAHWPLAKVVKVFPGADGLVRAVDLKLGTGVKRRPIVKLTVLVPVDMTSEESTDNLTAVRSVPGGGCPSLEQEDA